jgi:dTDP-4-dehydrorhamnose reductase
VIWLTGARGLLGTDLGRAFDVAGLPWIGTGREVDVTRPESIEAFGLGRSIDFVVNCAAYTAVDRAEDEPVLCQQLNVEGPTHLANWAEGSGAVLVQLSTDYVFSGRGKTAFLEDDPVVPTGVYGITKVQGETAVRDLCSRYLILRTSWLFGSAGPNFVHTMLDLFRTRDRVAVVDDQVGTPTWTVDLARVIVALIRRPAPPGTWHVSGEGQCTWYQFAQAILEGAKSRGLIDPGRQVELEPLSTSQYPTKAQRPAWSVLSKEKLRSQLGLELLPWRDALSAFLDTEPIPKRN